MTRSFRWFRDNGLTLAFFAMMALTIGGQIVSGHRVHDEFLLQHHQNRQSVWEYLTTGHFIEATFENWESEFLQMGLFVVLTIFLRQKGSSESKNTDAPNFDSSDLVPHDNSPAMVIKGGWHLSLYKNSLSLALFGLFIFSFVMHWIGSWMAHSEEALLTGMKKMSFGDFICTSKFWFESFQNWQSEFLSIAAVIFLSIYLRQYGSTQSKEVNASHQQTGE